jgi:hypothetical protein
MHHHVGGSAGFVPWNEPRGEMLWLFLLPTRHDSCLLERSGIAVLVERATSGPRDNF